MSSGKSSKAKGKRERVPDVPDDEDDVDIVGGINLSESYAAETPHERRAKIVATRKFDKKARETFSSIGGALPDAIKKVKSPDSEDVKAAMASSMPMWMSGYLKQDFPAYDKWTLDYLEESLGTQKVQVAVTPTVKQRHTVGTLLVEPLTKMLKFRKFVQHLRASENDGVYSVWGTKNNFIDQFKCLADDVPKTLKCLKGIHKRARSVGIFPDGLRHPLHNDIHDKVICVLSGKLRVTLYHALDAAFLYQTRFRIAHHVQDSSGAWSFEEAKPVRQHRWSAVDLQAPDMFRHPLFKYAVALNLTVNAGDALLIPVFWFHDITYEGDDEGKAVTVTYTLDPQAGECFTYLPSVESHYVDTVGERFGYEDDPNESEDDPDEDDSESRDYCREPTLPEGPGAY